MVSIYRWKGAVEKADERQLLIKTTEAQVGTLETRLRSLHPYEVPEFLVIRIAGGSPEYLAWLAESTIPE
jgi:periplasmic divalent cation tolerance protein